MFDSPLMIKALAVTVLSVTLSNCATSKSAYVARSANRNIPLKTVDEQLAQPISVPPGSRNQVVERAGQLVGQPHVMIRGRRFGDDCTGLVRAAFSEVGMDLMTSGQPGDNGVTAIYRFAQQHGRVYSGGRPLPGDLVFFHDTYDVDRDGSINDGLSHVAVVERIESDGTVTIIHRIGKGIVREHMNLLRPDERKSADGRTINDWLRGSAGGAPARFASQLFAGYATVLPVE